VDTLLASEDDVVAAPAPLAVDTDGRVFVVDSRAVTRDANDVPYVVRARIER
jgi:hypothetical protein